MTILRWHFTHQSTTNLVWFLLVKHDVEAARRVFFFFLKGGGGGSISTTTTTAGKLIWATPLSAGRACFFFAYRFKATPSKVIQSILLCFSQPPQRTLQTDFILGVSGKKRRG